MAEIVQGTVVSLIAGYYDVQTPAGVVRTRARGVFRKNREKPQVGDSVQVKLDEQGLAYLVKILPRKNRIGRPAVANVDHVLLVISAVEPDFSTALLDRFLVFFAWQGVEVTIYLSKSDLLEKEKLAEIESQLAYYQKIGYRVYLDRESLAQNFPSRSGKARSGLWLASQGRGSQLC